MIRSLIRELPYHTVVIHGACPTGADSIAHWEAMRHGLRVETYPVDHELDGPWPAAGPKRNSRMIRESKPEFCFGFATSADSKVTEDCMAKCKRAGIPTFALTPHSTHVDSMRVLITWKQLTLEEAE